MIKSLGGPRANLCLWGVCNAAFNYTRTIKEGCSAPMHPCTPYTGTMPPLLSSSLICRGKLFTWSSLHPLSLLTSQCCSLSTVILGSFRTSSLSFTLGSISMSLESISKARGRYIIQAWSSCPALIMTWSQVGRMLQLNSPSPYLHAILCWLREIHRTKQTLCSIKVCLLYCKFI